MKHLWLGYFFVILCVPGQANASSVFASTRDNLSNKGLTFEFSEKADVISVLKGGLVNKGTFLGLASMGLTVDTEKLGLWKGGELFLHGTNVHGHLKPTGEMVGDLQAVNNDEGPRTTRLYEVWYQQKLLDEKLAVLVGIHDLNADFMVSENAGLYVNGAFGVPTTLTANVPSSVYPLAAPAVRIKYTPIENLDFMVGVYDGDPGDPDINENSLSTRLREQDGALVIGEVGWHYKVLKDFVGSIKAGVWNHTKNFDDLAALDANGDPVIHTNNLGGYVILDQMLYVESHNQGLGAFVMFSGAPKDRNTISNHLAAGLNYTGLIPKRDEDVLGVAFTRSAFSSTLREIAGLTRTETTLEGTYQIKVNDNLTVQPDYQYVMNPSGDATIPNASVFTLRSELTF